MLTSAGRSRRMSESTAFGVGSMMSISRLCVRISKCSRLSLYLWGERMTTTTFFSVGSGTGPTTVAPARVTVSTILRAEVSMTSWSYDLSRMRIFCPAMSDSLSCYGVVRDGSLEPFFALDAGDVRGGTPLFFCQLVIEPVTGTELAPGLVGVRIERVLLPAA